MSQIIPYLAPGALTNTQSDVTDLQSLSGVPDNSVNLGTFTGSTIPDNQTAKQALQALETEVEDRLPDFVQWRVGTGPGYYFDGVNDYITVAKNLSGFDDLTLAFSVEVDSVATNQAILSDYVSGSDRTIDVRLLSSVLSFRFYDGGSSNFTVYTASAGVIQSGKRHQILFIRDAYAGSLFVDGEKVDLTKSTSGAGHDAPIPASANNLLVSSLVGVSDFLKGHVWGVQILNRAVTDAEAALLSRGQRLGFADRGATGSASYTSDFSAGVDSFAAATNVTIAGNIDAVSGVDDTLRIRSTSGSGTHDVYRLSTFTSGKRYRLTLSYYIPSGQSNVDGLRLDVGTQTIGTLSTVGSWQTAFFEFVNSSAAIADRLYVYLLDGGSTSFTDAGADDDAYLKSIVVTPIGEVLSLLPSGAAPTVWADQSGNGYNGTVSGATLINPMPLHADAFVSLTNLPTSSAGLATGRVWNDSGTLKIV